MANFRLALRVLARTPFVTTIAVLSLGLGLGANAAIFSLCSQILLKKLDVPAATELVNLSAPGPKSGMTSCSDAGSCDSIFSYPMFRDLERQQTSFTGLAAHRNVALNLSYKGTPIRSRGLEITGSYFNVLNLTPTAGRLINNSDDRVPGDSPVVVLSHRYWMGQLGGNPNVVNDTILVNGRSMTIIGIGPEGFDGTTVGFRPDVFLPITLAEVLQPNRKLFDNRRAYWMYVFGRLKPGVTMEHAGAQLNQVYSSVLSEVEAPLQKSMSAPTLERFKAKQVELASGEAGQSTVPEQAFQPLMLLLGVTLVVLITACANIANLLLAKAVGRAGEMAVRLSIGASRAQLVGQLLSESILLAVAGGLVGLLMGKATLTFLFSMLPNDVANWMTPSLDPKALLFLAAATVGTGLLFGLFPALHATRPNLSISLKGQAGQPGGSRSAKFFRSSLATAQITLSMGLLVVAGLFVKSLVNIHGDETGMRTDNIATFALAPGLNGYTMERSKQVLEAVEDALAATPGVVRYSGNMVPILAGDTWSTNVKVEGYTAAPDTRTDANVNEIAPGYFATLGIPLLAGRDFTRADTLGAPRVAIVNEAFARKFNLGANPVGKHLNIDGGEALDTEIVGLVKDAKYNSVKGTMPVQFFSPYRQDARANSLRFYVQAPEKMDAVMAAVRPMMQRVDATLLVEQLMPLNDQIRDNVFEDRLMGTMAASFAVLATILSAIGLYGVVAYSVAQRTREIGLRMALGADRSTIRTMVLRSVARMTIIGGVLGLGLALATGWQVRAHLYQMTSFDPTALISAVALLTTVALCAGIVPARRAAKVDPMRALRYE